MKTPKKTARRLTLKSETLNNVLGGCAHRTSLRCHANTVWNFTCCAYSNGVDICCD